MAREVLRKKTAAMPGPADVIFEPVPGDVDGDGQVNANDLATLLNQWGGPGSADLNHDGIVDAKDLATVLSNWTA